MRALVAELEGRRAEAAEGGPARARERHLARGKLLPRERVMTLIDPGTPFLELSPLAANGMYDDAIHGAGIITGIGRVSGRECVIVCNDSTIKGGTYYPMTVKKHLRAQEIARENRLAVHLSGRFRRRQSAASDRSVSRPRAFRPHLLQSGDDVGRRALPQIAVVMGSCTAGGAYVPAMSDETDHRAQPGHHLSRRPAAGEGRDRRGGQRRRARRRRCACAKIRRRRLSAPRTTAMRSHSCRRIVGNLNTKKSIDIPLAKPREPKYDAAELDGIVPADLKKQYDVREVIARLVDGSEFDEFKALYGTTLVTGFAHIHGMPVGILGNNGILFSESALKAAHFIELCCQRRVPLLFLQNISGFMVGRDYEAGGIAKDGAKMVTAVACAQVPKITRRHRRLLRRRQLRHVRPRLRPALSVHLAERPHLGDGRRAGGVACSPPCGATISRPKARSGPQVEEEEFKQPIREQYEAEGNPYYATARLWDDGIITPAETRRVLALCFSAALNAPIPETRFGVFRM